ncbi:MAG: transposase [Candidatus Oleimicrobiaceae bacterium]
MSYDPERHHRRSIRLKGYDYTQPGAYFVTLVTQNREYPFGDVVDGKMRLNTLGRIVADEWTKTAVLRPHVMVDAFIVMPNHIHAIIVLGDRGRGTLQGAPKGQRAPTTEQFGKPTSDSIPTIVRLLKSATTKRINALRATPGAPVWQRNYYEHIIRYEHALERIRHYIAENPMQWHLDRENTDAIGQDTEWDLWTGSPTTVVM